jgi:hypothetical protein
MGNTSNGEEEEEEEQSMQWFVLSSQNLSKGTWHVEEN